MYTSHLKQPFLELKGNRLGYSPQLLWVTKVRQKIRIEKVIFETSHSKVLPVQSYGFSNVRCKHF